MLAACRSRNGLRAAVFGCRVVRAESRIDAVVAVGVHYVLRRAIGERKASAMLFLLQSNNNMETVCDTRTTVVGQKLSKVNSCGTVRACDSGSGKHMQHAWNQARLLATIGKQANALAKQQQQRVCLVRDV